MRTYGPKLEWVDRLCAQEEEAGQFRALKQKYEGLAPSNMRGVRVGLFRRRTPSVCESVRKGSVRSTTQ